MSSIVGYGNSLTLSVQFYQYANGPAVDPQNLTFEIDFNNTPAFGPFQYGTGEIVRTGVGAYQIIWYVPIGTTVGNYTAIWDCDINGSDVTAYEDIEVVASGASTGVTHVSLNDPAIAVGPNWVTVKFYRSVKTSSINNSKFHLLLNSQISTEISDPFLDIDLSQDYDSISRTLKLYFKQPLAPSTSFILRVEELTDAANTLIPTVNYIFTTLEHVGYQVDVPPDNPTYVEDHSVIDELFTDATDIIEALNPEFYILTVDPEEPFIAANQNNGRVTITFSSTPLSAYISSQFFKVQKKVVSNTFTRWETVTAQISSSGSNVYIDFPSYDATPVYHTAAHSYFSEGVKYRIKVSKDVGTSTDATPSTAEQFLGEDKLYYFLVGLTPMFADVEDISTQFPESSPVEIAELIYDFSVEAQVLTGLVDPTPLMREFVIASVACALSRAYGFMGGGDETSFTLGDLTVQNSNSGRSPQKVTRFNASSWCELAGVLREELLIVSGKTGIKAIVKGSKVIPPMPSRLVRHQEFRGWDGD